MATSSNPNHIKRYLSYFFMGVVSVMFIMAGAAKLMGSEELWQQFVAFGYPYWFFIATGVIEILAALLLWSVHTRILGAALVIATMLGALYSNITVGASQFYVVNISIALLAAVIIWLNRDKWPLNR